MPERGGLPYEPWGQKILGYKEQSNGEENISVEKVDLGLHQHFCYAVYQL